MLLSTLAYRPFLIKPNKDELSALVGRELQTEEDVVSSARLLQEKGAKNVLVSLGAEGAILLAEDGSVYTVSPHAITPVNSVGAGDSMVAGFLAGVDRGYDYALKLGNAAGSATAASAGLATKEEIEELLRGTF